LTQSLPSNTEIWDHFHDSVRGVCPRLSETVAGFVLIISVFPTTILCHQRVGHSAVLRPQYEGIRSPHSYI